jgi:hypothetical protein
VPLPTPRIAVTVQVVPLPVTAAMDAPLSPVDTRLNAVELTPVTLRLKVTVHATVEAVVACVQVLAQVIAVTVAVGVM